VELADLSVGLPLGIGVSVRLTESVEKTAQLPLPEGDALEYYAVYSPPPTFARS
jgi:hypothetical protein